MSRRRVDVDPHEEQVLQGRISDNDFTMVAVDFSPRGDRPQRIFRRVATPEWFFRPYESKSPRGTIRASLRDANHIIPLHHRGLKSTATIVHDDDQAFDHVPGLRRMPY